MVQDRRAFEVIAADLVFLGVALVVILSILIAFCMDDDSPDE